MRLTPIYACNAPGEGVTRDTAFAAELLRHAADAGDPGAQGEVGWRAALGLRPSADHLFAFGRPDVPRCTASRIASRASCSPCCQQLLTSQLWLTTCGMLEQPLYCSMTRSSRRSDEHH